MLLFAAATGPLRWPGLTGLIVDAFVNDEIRFLETLIEMVQSYSPKNCHSFQLNQLVFPELKCGTLWEIEYFYVFTSLYFGILHVRAASLLIVFMSNLQIRQ